MVEDIKKNGPRRMVTCSFLGHRNQYDIGLLDKIKRATNKVVQGNQEIEFLFYGAMSNPFYRLCMNAVLEAKNYYPQKKIVMTSISEDRSQTDVLTNEQFPACVYNRLIKIPDTKSKMRFIMERKRTERDIIRASDYLICYLYPELRDDSIDIYEFAIRHPWLKVLNVKNMDTTKFIQDSVTRLTTKQQYIFHGLTKGISYREIGNVFGVSGSAIHTADSKARRSLREFARERFSQLQGEELRPPVTCTAIMPNSKTCAVDEKEFRRIVYFLIQQLGVTIFFVEQNNAYSPHVQHLCRICAYYGIRTVAITHLSAPSVEVWSSVERRYVPPFSEVQNIDPETGVTNAKYFRTLAAILARSDYAICDLSSDLAIKMNIPKKLKKHKHLSVFDLSTPQEVITLQDAGDFSKLY